jgi:excisionase family DNA binding protein
VSELARALLDELAADPVALERLRMLVAPAAPAPAHQAAYTVASLAAELGRSERSIRSAIARGELSAVKRGRGWVISADAVAAWATADVSRPPQRPRGRRDPRCGRGTGVMARALKV